MANSSAALTFQSLEIHDAPIGARRCQLHRQIAIAGYQNDHIRPHLERVDCHHDVNVGLVTAFFARPRATATKKQAVLVIKTDALGIPNRQL